MCVCTYVCVVMYTGMEVPLEAGEDGSPGPGVTGN